MVGKKKTLEKQQNRNDSLKKTLLEKMRNIHASSEKNAALSQNKSYSVMEICWTSEVILSNWLVK